jgi:hypothetical protein
VLYDIIIDRDPRKERLAATLMRIWFIPRAATDSDILAKNVSRRWPLYKLWARF